MNSAVVFSGALPEQQRFYFRTPAGVGLRLSKSQCESAAMRTGRPPTRRDAHVAPEPGDEIEGDYTRERLEEMDARFSERVERAISPGREQPTTA